MALANVDELLEALAQRDTWSRLSGEAAAASQAWVNCVNRTREWSRKICATPGVDKLTLMCRAAAGRNLDHDWLAEQHAKLVLANGGSRSATKNIDKMTPAAFAMKVGSEPKGNGQSREGKTKAIEKYGRPRDTDVAKRREYVRKFSDKGMSRGEISIGLHELQQKGKLPKTLKVGVDNVASDLKELGKKK